MMIYCVIFMYSAYWWWSSVQFDFAVVVCDVSIDNNR